MIVGDIHGCLDEFCELLDLYHKPDDLLILAGDLVLPASRCIVPLISFQVNKGPHSLEVLRKARDLGALAVQGNHEVKPTAVTQRLTAACAAVGLVEGVGS